MGWRGWGSSFDLRCQAHTPALHLAEVMTPRTPGPDVFGMNSLQPIWLETDPEGLHCPAAEGILLPTEFVPFSCRGKLRGSQVGQFLVDVMSKGTELRVHAGAKAKHGIPAKRTHMESQDAWRQCPWSARTDPCPLSHTIVWPSLVM